MHTILEFYLNNYYLLSQIHCEPSFQWGLELSSSTGRCESGSTCPQLLRVEAIPGDSGQGTAGLISHGQLLAERQHTGDVIQRASGWIPQTNQQIHKLNREVQVAQPEEWGLQGAVLPHPSFAAINY